MLDQNNVNIPAFRRKRSLAQKARAKTTSPARVLKNEISIVKDTINIPFSPPSAEENFNPESAKGKSKITEMIICGTCDGYFDKINVAVINVTNPVRLNNVLFFETTSGLFGQKVISMQQNKKDIRLARSGSDIGLKVLREPKVGGNVYKEI